MSASNATKAPFRVRLTLPYASYIANPVETIRQSLGRHITIEHITHSDIILPDDTVVVDVTYQSIQISLFQIYFIPTDTIKPIMPDSDKYVANVDGNYVKITIPNINDYPKLIPVRILSTLPTSSDASQLQISYFGTIVTQPLSTLCTPIRYLNHAYEPFDVPRVKPLTSDEQSYVSKPTDAEIFETCRNYKSALILHNILSAVTDVTYVKTFAECKLGTTGYVLPFSAIPIDQDINGIILIQPKRIPDYVMFYPTSACTICIEELESIKRFLDQDLVNYNNFMHAQRLNSQT